MYCFFYRRGWDGSPGSGVLIVNYTFFFNICDPLLDPGPFTISRLIHAHISRKFLLTHLPVWLLIFPDGSLKCKEMLCLQYVLYENEDNQCFKHWSLSLLLNHQRELTLMIWLSKEGVKLRPAGDPVSVKARSWPRPIVSFGRRRSLHILYISSPHLPLY